MRSFLLWTNNTARNIEPAEVASRFQSIFAPLFVEPPSLRILHCACVNLVSLELPIRHWKPSCFEQGDGRWVLAPEYPVNARSVLKTHGIRFHDNDVLLTLSQCLRRNPTPFLKDLAPPFSLISADEKSGEINFQNDGLGMAQLFQYEKGQTWALTNRILSLKALNITIEPEPEIWATRLTLGWFPLRHTGYNNIQFVAPATQGRIKSTGRYYRRHDVLRDWIHPDPMSKDECCELARSSLLGFIEEASSLFEGSIKVGLSGGWDSRTLVAILRNLKADFSLRVRGAPERRDVIIASHLAKLAGINLDVKNKSGLPPDDADACRLCICRALRWQAGHMSTSKHKTFMARHKYLKEGSVNIMGQHGGIGKAEFVTKINGHELKPHQYEARFIKELMKNMPAFTHQKLRDTIYEIMLEAYRQADEYGLAGLSKLHFFYLFEHTRRWASGSLNSQTSFVVAPFLNPDFVRACYAYPVKELSNKPFHHYITNYYAPDWENIPRADEVTRAALYAQGIGPPIMSSHDPTASVSSWKQPRGNKKYSLSEYWCEVGTPIIHSAFEQDGFWTTIFDPHLAKQQWLSAPDELAIAYLLPVALE